MTSQNKTLVTINDNAVQDGQTIDAADVTVAFDDVQTELQNGWSRVSANDTNVKHLEDAVVGGTGITATTVNDGADETLSIAVDDTVVATTSNSITLASKTLTTPTISDFTNATHDHQDAAGGGQLLANAIDSDVATSGYVLTADGAGGASWAAVGGGGAQPIDLTATAGETLAERNMVYLDETTGTWFKLDTDATGAIKCGALRGCVNESGGIASASTGSVRILGEVSGFSGLTAWNRVYGGTTAGGYTQTRPAVTDGGGQIAIAELGVATSTTAIFIQPQPVIYANRETLGNNGTMTIEHHSDSRTRKRVPRAYVATTVAGSSVASYASSNQDRDVDLEGRTFSGDSISISGTGSSLAIGDVSGIERTQAQSFTTVNGGELTSFSFDLIANVGSPSGDITWTIHADNSAEPGSSLLTGTIAPTASATNTVSGLSLFLDAATVYWLSLSTTAQATNNSYRWSWGTSSSYSGGGKIGSNDGGTTWINPDVIDTASSFTISAVTEKDKLAQSFQVTGSQTLASVDLWLKKTGTPTGTMTLRVETDSAGSPSGTLVDANATTTVAESGLGTSYADVTFTFGTSFSISGATTYWLVLSTDRAQSATNYVTWGADTSSPSYSNGEMKSEVSAAWGAESADAIFDVLAEDTQYDEPCVIGRWSGGTRDMAIRFDDGAAGDPNTKTTFKNVSGGSLDIVAEVEVI